MKAVHVYLELQYTQKRAQFVVVVVVVVVVFVVVVVVIAALLVPLGCQCSISQFSKSDSYKYIPTSVLKLIFFPFYPHQGKYRGF